ncbi:MFS transporter [Terrabacter terrigena]|uniref:MFS transporter n=1 Tax=Terrabacter terrigena TaxID=574718 RepID=A0ABW3MV65_9MICO
MSLQALVVVVLHGTAADVGWLNAARSLPYLVLGLLVDGRRRLPLMVGTYIVQAVLLLTVPLLWWLELLSLPTLMVIVTLSGTAAVINGAAEMSFLPRLLEPRRGVSLRGGGGGPRCHADPQRPRCRVAAQTGTDDARPGPPRPRAQRVKVRWVTPLGVDTASTA